MCMCIHIRKENADRMEILAIVAQKGGVGKTSSAQAIGSGLALFHGARVLFVDTDAQGNLSRSMEADRSGATPDTLEALTGRATAEEAIQHTPQGDIIASSPALSGADREDTLSKIGREYRLKNALKGISDQYDYCIIDTPPALSIITVNALTACHRAIIPAQADDYSIDALEHLKETIDTVRTYCNPSLSVDGILLTRYNGRSVLSREIAEMMEAQAAALGTRVYTTRIRECTAIKEAQAMRETLFTYSPRSNAAKDYKSVIEEIMGRRNNGKII